MPVASLRLELPAKKGHAHGLTNVYTLSAKVPCGVPTVDCSDSPLDSCSFRPRSRDAHLHTSLLLRYALCEAMCQGARSGFWVSFNKRKSHAAACAEVAAQEEDPGRTKTRLSRVRLDHSLTLSYLIKYSVLYTGMSIVVCHVW